MNSNNEQDKSRGIPSEAFADKARIEQVAVEILIKYKKAFEELAK